MKKVTPIGYSDQSTGKFMAAMTVIGAVLITAPLVTSGAPIQAMVPLFVIAGILAVLFLISDVTTDRKRKEKIAHMNDMLACPSVTGEVVEIKQIPFFFGREFPDPPKYVYINGKHSIYRLVVSFHSPVTDRKETIVSEPYNIGIQSQVKDGRVDVHYSEKGEYWISV